MIAIAGIQLLAALLLPQEMATLDPNAPGSIDESSFNLPLQDWYDDPDAEAVSTLGIRPGVPHTGRDNGDGTATVTFPNPIAITISPPRIGFPIPGYNRTPRSIRVPAGSQFTGHDRNRNRIPDDLEMEMVDVRNQ